MEPHRAAGRRVRRRGAGPLPGGHARLARERTHGQRIITTLFRSFIRSPALLPEFFRVRVDATDPLPIVVKDYIAGMTDDFARKEYTRITHTI